MGSSFDDLPGGHMRLLDNFVPGLKDATYQITVSQTVSAPGIDIPMRNQTFVVSGPRFSLDPGDFHAQFPPKGASGQFAEVLAHVVLNKRLLPWERDIPGLPRTVPWLALLLFEEGELIGDSQDSNVVAADYARTMTVKELHEQPADSVRVPDLGSLSADDEATRCQVITLSSATFTAIVPTALELPFLAHVRQVDTSGKAELNMKDEGLFSVVVANRFPLAGEVGRGAKAIVHLVSLEGFGTLLGGPAPMRPTQPQVQMISLASWSFSCLPDPSQRFSGLARNLAYDLAGARRPAATLALRLPFASSAAPADAEVAAARRLAAGYVPLGYHASSGEDGFAWYRGPLSPVEPSPVPKQGPFESASAAAIYDRLSGVFDQSLAVAWQCGRSFAMANQAFAITLMRLRQRVGAQLGHMAMRAATGPAWDAQATHGRFAGLLAGGALRSLQRISNASRVARSAPPARPVDQRVPAEVLRSFLANPDSAAALGAMVADDPDALAVARWLGQLWLLRGLPFAHLVPDGRMLPIESIRFFFLDANWLAALMDGALQVGLGDSRQSAVQRALTMHLQEMAIGEALASRDKAQTAAASPAAGLLIRSALVTGWPGTTVAGKAGGVPTPLLRLERVGADVLICLFNGVPDTITLAEPHEGLEFGVDDQGRLATRTVSGASIDAGQELTVFEPANPSASRPTLRDGGQRVLNINIDPNYATAGIPAGKTDLLTSLASTLNPPQPVSSLHPALFALQMVKGPEELSFAVTPR